MKRLLPLLPLLALAGCAASGKPFSPVRDVRYSAIGADPFWMVAIGDDAIVLTRTGEGRRLASIRYPRVLPRTEGEVKTWESAGGTAVIAVQARPGPCTGPRGRRYEDAVRVRLSGVELHGCGGRLIEGRRG
jgi:uncharacterized membrane protein